MNRALNINTKEAANALLLQEAVIIGLERTVKTIFMRHGRAEGG
jgi:hypothetical protein